MDGNPGETCYRFGSMGRSHKLSRHATRDDWTLSQPSRHRQKTFSMTLQFTLQFCIGRIMLFCQAIKFAEYFSVIKPFEGFGSKKTPRPYANNSVVRVMKLRLFPSPPRALDSCTRCRFFGGTCISKKSWDYTIISYFLGVLYCYMHCPYFISLKLRDF